MKRVSGLLPCIILFLLPGASLSAQTTPSSDQPIYKATTREVIVDVVATGSKGDAAPSLRKEQFQVLEDGKPQTIDFFEEHGFKAPVSLPPLPKMPPGLYTNVPPAPVDDVVNVLLLDSLNTPPQSSAYARNEILAYLDKVKPGTRLAIITLNDKLNIVQGFTTDAALLRDVAIKQTGPGLSTALVTKTEITGEQDLEAFLNSNSPGAANGANTGTSASAVRAVPMMATMAVANAFASYQNFQSAQRTRMTLEALSDIARYLAAVPGRKNLIWFAGDFPVVIFPKFDQRMSNEQNAIEAHDVRKAADLLTKARVAVYPIYANGMMSDDTLTADSRTSTQNFTAANSDRAGVISAMNQIATDTGGKAAYNTNDIESAIGRSIADGSHYYTLVYSPANKNMDGHYRKIEVKLVDSKLKLSYRHGYNADADTSLPGAKKEDDPLRRQLVHDTPNATQILFAARVVPSTPPPGGKLAGRNAKLTGPLTRYSIDLFIRWNDIALAPQPDGTHKGQIEVGLIAWDSTGKSINWEGGTEQMALKPDVYAAIEKSGIPAHMEVDLPNTDLFLKLGVVDGSTGKTGTLEIPLHPTSASAGATPAQHP